MSDIEHARMLLIMARKDLMALSGMTDPKIFAEEVFGFHAQQTVEKSLKAWLSLQGVGYPKTHDISLLLHLLEEQQVDLDALWDLVEYNAYAVQFRYEAYETDDGDILDRGAVIKRLSSLIEKVVALLPPGDHEK